MHGTTFRAGAESAVYDCLVFRCKPATTDTRPLLCAIRHGCGPPSAQQGHHYAIVAIVKQANRRCRSKSGPALGGTEYRLMPSACRLIVRAKL